MRYADGGGLTMEGRSRREQVRLQAAEMFEQDVDARQVASSLRVSTKSVYQWRRAWQSGGEAHWPRKGLAGTPASWTRSRSRSCARRWTPARRLTGGSWTSGGPWPGSRR
jgi:transposase